MHTWGQIILEGWTRIKKAMPQCLKNCCLALSTFFGWVLTRGGSRWMLIRGPELSCWAWRMKRWADLRLQGHGRSPLRGDRLGCDLCWGYSACSPLVSAFLKEVFLFHVLLPSGGGFIHIWGWIIIAGKSACIWTLDILKVSNCVALPTCCYSLWRSGMPSQSTRMMCLDAPHPQLSPTMASCGMLVQLG